MSEITRWTATELARAISSKRVSATEAVRAYLARIERMNGALNAVVTLDAEGALAAATRADAALARGDLLGPLHGVPITLKDCHATGGLRTTVGYPPLRDFVPREDGTTAARSRAAGAILLGKTNVPPLLGGPYTDNPIFGRTNNPWNLERTPGGSSGGSAAAVAAGMAALDVGSDALGSVRLPAHFCGIFGLKPSERRVPLTGHHCFGDLPGGPRAWRAICCIGPLARSVEDLALAFGVLAGPDGRDTDVPPVPRARVPRLELRTLRIGWSRTFPGVPVSRDVSDAVERVAGELAAAGARVEERTLPLGADGYDDMWALIQLVGTSPDVAKVEPATPRIVELVRLLDARDVIMRSFDAFAEQMDAFLCPPAVSTAFAHGRVREPILVDGVATDFRHAAHHCLPFNMSGQPGVVLPVGLSSEGLPVGVQLVGRRWHDEHLLGVAEAVAELTGPARRPPEP